MPTTNAREWLLVSGIFLVANVVNCVYFAFGRAPSGSFAALYILAIGWVIAAWVLADSRRLAVPLPFDMGWFVFFAWPFVLPYHAFKTRGFRGLLILGAFLGLYLLTYLVGIGVFFAIVVMRGSVESAA